MEQPHFGGNFFVISRRDVGFLKIEWSKGFLMQIFEISSPENPISGVLHTSVLFLEAWYEIICLWWPCSGHLEFLESCHAPKSLPWLFCIARPSSYGNWSQNFCHSYAHKWPPGHRLSNECRPSWISMSKLGLIIKIISDLESSWLTCMKKCLHTWF